MSAVGWVKPGDTYPFRVLVKNFTSSAASNAQVTIPAADGMVFAMRPPSGGTVSVSPTSLDVDDRLGRRPGPERPGPEDARRRRTGRHARPGPADRLEEPLDDRHASPTRAARPSSSTSHGPKVIPPKADVSTRPATATGPFPVVPVDYFDRKHEAAHSGERLCDKSSTRRRFAGSTFNLYQEMSYGQLFPNGTVPSAGIASRGLGLRARLRLHDSRQPQGTCTGTTLHGLPRHARSTPSGSRTAGTSCRATPTTTATTSSARRTRRRDRPASARCCRSTTPAGRPARPSTTRPRSPTRRSTTPTTTPTRTASSTSS